MDHCPHCDEPLDPKAQACPHCGSDFETGWNPDADYYGVDLPEEEPFDPLGQPRAARAAKRPEDFVTTAATLAFALVLGFLVLERYGAGGAVATFFVLAACYWAFQRRLRRRQ